MANTNTKTAPRSTKIKESFGSRLFDVVDVLIICLLLACVLIPLIHIVAASFSNPSLFVGHKGILLWPEGFSLASYQAVFKNTFLWTGYANTLFIVLVGTVLNVLLSMVAAYCLSRKRVAAGPTIMKLLVFTMYFSGGMIPLYLVVKGVGLYGSRWALILPTLVDTYNLIIMRTAFAGVPDSLEESAKLDGANAWTILWRIMAPLVKPRSYHSTYAAERTHDRCRQRDMQKVQERTGDNRNQVDIGQNLLPFEFCAFLQAGTCVRPEKNQLNNDESAGIHDIFLAEQSLD